MNLGRTFDSILPVLGQLAPTIASMIGGPIAGMAVQSVATALGLTPEQAKDPAQIVAAVNGMTFEQMTALRKADQEFAEKMKELDLEPEKLANADRADARVMQTKLDDWVPKALAIAVTVGFFGLIGILCRYTIPPENIRVVDVMLGSLGTGFLTVLAFYFGSSASSHAKDETIGKLAAAP